jgi:hypothetical protein
MYKPLYRIVFCIAGVFLGTIAHAQFSQKFAVNSQRKVMIESPDNFMSIEIFNNQNDSIQLITNYNFIETDNIISFQVSDYNFDGNKDFSISYPQAGNTIYHLFIYNPHTKEFNRIYFPTNTKAMCESFSNISLDSQKKHIISTCKNEDNQNYTDIWIINEDGIAEFTGKKK